MIRNIIDLSDKELQLLKTSPVSVVEMIDGLLFKVSFTDSGYVIKTAKGKVIDEIDYLVNNIYRDVVDYMENVITAKTLADIINVLGCCEATFIYVPKEKYNVISYDNYTKKRIVLCSLYTDDKSKNDIVWLYTLLKDYIEPVPVIGGFEYGVPYSFFENFDIHQLINFTFSGNSVNDIEGVVLKIGNRNICKVIINPTTVSIDVTTKKIYRDAIIEDFAKVMSSVSLDNLIKDNDSYVECICNMFYDYINRTDISKKIYIEPSDLLPPSSGNVGDMDLNLLPPTAKIICNHKVYMNILRLLLVTFNTEDVHKFDTFTEPVKNTLVRIINKINNV